MSLSETQKAQISTRLDKVAAEREAVLTPVKTEPVVNRPEVNSTKSADRKVYMREYMRKRRAAAKTAKAG